MEKLRLGLIVNPVAGLGGRVGLKGSDGLEIQQRARALGAVPEAGRRAAQALQPLRPLQETLTLLTASGEMGADIAREAGFEPQIVGANSAAATTAEDTRAAASQMQAAGVQLLLFAGGDGTARDIYEAVGTDIPTLGIPAGVKIHSAVFAVNPRSAGELAADFARGRGGGLREAEVVDLDEAAYRAGTVATCLHGYLRVPARRRLMQNQKAPSPASEAVAVQAIAVEVVDAMSLGCLYVLGPGTTTRAIAARLGVPKTLVGVDVVARTAAGGELLAADVAERQLLALAEGRLARIVVTPIGGQGFLFGRGNQPIGPRLLRRVGRANVIVAGTVAKLNALGGRPLRVDTGDPAVDALLAGYVAIITGYRERVIYKVSA
jgi:predicted polyphosphate/ATP-dependent NAD kinase